MRARTAGRVLRRVVLWSTALAALWLGSSWAAAYVLTHRFGSPRPEPQPRIPGVTVSAERLETSDGETLGAWWLRRPDQDGGPGVVLLHGRSGTRAVRLPHARAFLAAGCQVLDVTLRANGDSTGRLDDVGWSARHDVVAAVRFLEERRPARPIVVCGASMGAAAAIFAAAELGPRVAGYVLECPYRDLRTALRHRTRIYLPPGLDRVASLGLEIAGKWVLDDVDAIAPIDGVADIPPQTPVLFLAGGRDRRAPLLEVRELADATGPNAELVVFGEATHDALFQADPERYRQVVAEFVQRRVLR